MGVSPREKKMLAMLFGFAGLILIGFFGILPAWDQMTQDIKKKDELTHELKQLESEEQAASATLKQYQRSVDIPKDIVVREFKPNTFEQNVKEMLDQLVHLATDAGNDMISLAPSNDVSADASNSKPDQKTSGGASSSNNNSPGNTGASGSSTTAGTATPATPQVSLRKFAFDLSVRGNYTNIITFLRALNTYHELIEVSSITLENEAGPTRGAVTDTTKHVNPLKPLKLTSKLIVYLKPSV